MPKLIQINLQFSCAGLIVEEGIILNSAPIFKGWRGRRLNEFIQYYKSTGDFIDINIKEEK